MFEFVFELIDLFFTFYPKSIDIKIVLWNTFENVQNKKIIATCMRKHNLCSLVFFFAASLPLSFLYSTPWTEISSTLNFRFKQNLNKKVVAASSSLSCIHTIPWTEISKLTISIWHSVVSPNRKSSSFFVGRCLKFLLKTLCLSISEQKSTIHCFKADFLYLIDEICISNLPWGTCWDLWWA